MSAKKNKHIFVASWVALAFILLISLVITYWSAVPFKPVITVQGDKLYVKNKTVKAGNYLVLTYDVCKNQNLTGMVTRYLQDNQIIFLPSLESNQPAGCKHVETSVMIPSGTPTDTYTFHSTITYKVSPIKSVSYTYSTDEFKVIGKDE